MRSLFIYDFKVTHQNSNKHYYKGILRSIWGLINNFHKLFMWFEVKIIFWTFTSLYVCAKLKQVSNVNMSVPESNFEGLLLLMCLAAVRFWKVRKLEGCCTSFHLLWKSVLNYFGWVEVRILVGRWNIYEAHIFTWLFAQIWCLETITMRLLRG